MRSIKIIFLAFLLPLFIFSCSSSSSSDNFTHHVKYQISPLDGSVIYIKYNNAAGSFDEITDFNQFASSGDSKTIGITTTPFDAKLEVTVNNTTANIKHYILAIYVDDVPKSAYYLDVPPNATSTGQTEFVVPQ